MLETMLKILKNIKNSVQSKKFNNLNKYFNYPSSY